MINWGTYRTKEWDKDLGYNIDYAKKAILGILKDQGVSLSHVRYLFNRILEEIEDKNPIVLPFEDKNTDLAVIVVPNDYPVYTMPSYQPSEKTKEKLIPVEHV